MIVRYKILFISEFLHDYYKDGKCGDFSLLPSAQTAGLMKNGGMLCKIRGNKLIVLIKVDEDGRPVINLPADDKFVFYIELNRHEFMTVTNPVNISRGRYYFSNLNQNLQGSVLNLTAPIAAYDASAAYAPGDMADAGGGNIFECIKTSTGNDTGNTAFWTARGQVQYTGEQDILPFKTSIINFKLPVAANVFTIQVFGLNTAGNLYDKPVLNETQALDPGKTSDLVQLNMSSLPAGRYVVNINGEEFDIYRDDAAVYSNALGVIEIFTHLPGANAFALLDSQGKAKEFTYTIRFANRRAFWKYFATRLRVSDLKVSGSSPAVHPFDAFSTDIIGAPTRKDYFVSKQPLLLSESPSLNNFELELVAPYSSDFPAAPKPDPANTGMLAQTGDDFYCNIFLNY